DSPQNSAILETGRCRSTRPARRIPGREMRSSAKAAAVMVLLCLGVTEAHATPPPRQAEQVVAGAVEQTGYTRLYDPAYVQLAYPGGDPPPDRGVCSDVVVRAVRRAGADLQKEVHEDMARTFGAYPNEAHQRA